MTTLAKITISLILALFLSSCGLDINFGDGKKGNGTVATETRTVTEDFTAVTASEGLDVFVVQGKTLGIEVEADENIIDLIGTDIKNGRLTIHAIENIGKATKTVRVTLPEITALESSSGADLIVENAIEADKIDLDATSGADLEVELSANEINASASSGADITVSGKVNVLFADASSGADISAKELLSKICHAEASSGADISVNISESLTADASSGGDISYIGEGNVQKNKSSSGSVHKL
ncbi:MAG: head GIN domain-containing protein [Sediminicola sp.]